MHWTLMCYISHSSLSDNHFIHRFFYFAPTAWTTMEAYCVKCKSKRSMKDEKKVTMKNGRPATTGICSICGTKMFKIGKWSFLTFCFPLDCKVFVLYLLLLLISFMRIQFYVNKMYYSIIVNKISAITVPLRN